MKDEEKKKLELNNPTIYQTNENCQVFNGPISGCVFAMPGAMVNQSPVQQVDAAKDEWQQAPSMEQPVASEEHEFVNLVFFDAKLFGTVERQMALRKVLNEAFKKMKLDTGRDLVAVFIAYHFLKNQLSNIKGYTSFLQDIEGLMPGALSKVKENETSRSLRYKSYAESLATECEKWFISNGTLPEMQEWTSSQYRYRVDDERRKRIHVLVKDIYLGMKEAIK